MSKGGHSFNRTNSEEMLGLPQETEICVLGPGEICGDIAAFLDVPQPVSGAFASPSSLIKRPTN